MQRTIKDLMRPPRAFCHLTTLAFYCACILPTRSASRQASAPEPIR